MERGKLDKGNTPGSQRGRRGDERAAYGNKATEKI
jgi:hypothetical protein